MVRAFRPSGNVEAAGAANPLLQAVIQIRYTPDSPEEERLGSTGTRRYAANALSNHQRAQLLHYFHADGDLTDKQSCRSVAAGAARTHGYDSAQAYSDEILKVVGSAGRQAI